ncbi:MAG: branched-chain amino acid ABC transporter substrate-binding protein [Geminicoccaceae bacterium]
MQRFAYALIASTAGIALATAAEAEVVIATAGPMTGQYAAFGEQMQKGAEMAVADINAAGGVLGEQLTLVVGDDRCDPKEAVAVANKFVNDGVIFVAGHFCSGSSIPASNVYTEEGILQISPASTNPALTDEGGDNVFRVCGRDDQQGGFAGAWLQENMGDQRIAIAHDKQAYSKGLADETKKALNAAGLDEVMYETVNPGERDYSAFVTKLKAAEIDALYYGGYHTELGLIARQMREQGLEAQILSGDALNAQEFWSITGEAGEGVMFTFAPDPRNNPAAADVVERFRADGYEPEGYTLYTYAAIQVWKDAVEAAGTFDLDPVIEALIAGEFETVIGPRAFDEKGDITTSDYVWYEWSEGNYAEIN